MNAKIYTKDAAPEGSKELLTQVEKAYKFIPHLMGALAESSPVLESYIQLGDQLSKTSLSPKEVQVLYLAINFENECHYCMAAHSTVANMVGLPEHITQALRTGDQLDDPKLNALATFTRKVVQDRGWVKEEDVQEFLNAGYTQANIYDVILGVAHKTISNYVNHIFKTPVDDAFKPQAWSKS